MIKLQSKLICEQNKSVQQNNYLYAVKLYMTVTIQRLCGTYNNTIKFITLNL